jgi:hypothetical protein
MGTLHIRRLYWLGLILASLVTQTLPSWAQDTIGSVLVVEGTAEVRAQNATVWAALKFRDGIFLGDTVRTQADSKIKVLLRDESVMTLGENSEMQFSEFLLDAQQQRRRNVVSLAVGRLRVLTQNLFGAGSVTEVHTPNTVAGVRGTTFMVIFTPPALTEIIGLDGVVSARNLDPAVPNLEPVPQNFRTRIVGNTPPGPATPISPAERRALEQTLQIKAQVPSVVTPTRLRTAATAPPRGAVAGISPGGGPLPAPLPPPPSPDRLARGGPLDLGRGPDHMHDALLQMQTIPPEQTSTGQQAIEQSQVRIIITFPR